MTVPRRSLGRSGLRVGPIALGGNVFGWTADERASFRVLDGFVSAGFNLIDTADVYSIWVDGHRGGESETILGQWLREGGRRTEVVLATKVGMDMGPGGKGLSADHIRKSVAGSLARLGTDHIDLYQAHEDDPATPLAETLGAFQALVDEGTVRAIGASNYSAARLAESLRVSAERGLPRFETLQPRYNLMDRVEFEGELAPLCRTEDLGVLAYASLASGFLTGKYRSAADASKSPRGARAIARLNERGHRILAALDEVSASTGASPTSVALAWLIARPGTVIPIASARTEAQLAPILAAAQLTLSADALARLDRASGP